MSKQPTIEEAVSQLRKLLGPYPQIIVDIRDCGKETRSKHGRIEYAAQNRHERTGLHRSDYGERVGPGPQGA